MDRSLAVVWCALIAGLGCGVQGTVTTPDVDASAETSSDSSGGDALGGRDGSDAPDPLDAGDAGPFTDADAADVAHPPDDGATEADGATGDVLAALCDGFLTAPFQPPLVCDKSGGNTSSEKPSNSIYATSWFGCYRRSDGTIYKDPTDNCEFACGNKGLCAAGATGPECESSLQWFSADADRYGCGTRLRLTNCANGKRVVVVALDRGPNCNNEQSFGAPVIDMSHAAMIELFDGNTYGGSDKERIIVEVVDPTTPLGPVAP